MIKPRRIGHATFETPDLPRLVDYYTEVMGLVLAEQDKDRAFLATTIGQLAIQINKGDVERCSMLSFEVAPEFRIRRARPRTGKGRGQKRAAQRFHSGRGPGADVSRTTRARRSRCSRNGAISASTWRITASGR